MHIDHYDNVLMDTARWNEVKAVFGDVLALPPDQRAAFLADACGTDADLHAQVASLLASYDEAPAYFDSLDDSIPTGHCPDALERQGL